MKYEELYPPVEVWIRRQTGLGEAMTAASLAAWQQERLEGIREYAARHSRFYAVPRDFTTPEDIRRDPEAFLCVPPKEVARIITLKTSGSQGSPKRLFFTAEDLLATADFFTPGMSYLTKPGQLVTVFMEGPGRFTVGGLLTIALQARNITTRVHGLIRSLPEAARAAKGAYCLVGVPSQMMRLACFAPDLRPGTVLLSGDYVPDSILRTLQQTWGCEVFTHWGMTETGYGGGVECGAHNGYHMRDADLYIEILDPATGEPVPDGSYGEIVLTTLRRKGMPLIRYRTGDIGRRLTEPCTCGSILPRLDKVMGRLENAIFLPDGNAITIHQLDELLFSCSGICDYEARMTEEYELILTVDGSGDLELIESRVQERWPALRIQIQQGTVLPCKGQAKRKIISE